MMSTSILITGGTPSVRIRETREIITGFGADLTPNQPDIIFWDFPEAIGIDRIRDLQSRLKLRPLNLPRKFAVICRAENLTIEAQNALLKLLEEPPGDTIIILLSPTEELILPTIVSRCRIIPLSPEAEISLESGEKKALEETLGWIATGNIPRGFRWAETLSKDRANAKQQLLKMLLVARRQLLQDKNRQSSRQIRRLQQALVYLHANINVRLTLENLFLPEPS